MLLQRRPHFLIVEKKIPGSTGQDGHCFSERLGEDLGLSLAQWHSIDCRPYLIPPRDHHFHDETFILSCRNAFEYTDRMPADSRAHWKTMIDSAAEWLGDPSFLGDVVLGHGDLHRGNVVVDDRHVHWIDLEVVKRYPRHVDLVSCVKRLLHRCEVSMAAFERAYFSAHPDHERHWRKHRLQCIRFVTTQEACRKFKPPSRLRKGAKDVMESKSQLARAYELFADAEAAFEMKDHGQSTFEMVQTMRQRRKQIFRERAPKDLQDHIKKKRLSARAISAHLQ